jgi:hypothetical protein
MGYRNISVAIFADLISLTQEWQKKIDDLP